MFTDHEVTPTYYYYTIEAYMQGLLFCRVPFLRPLPFPCLEDANVPRLAWLAAPGVDSRGGLGMAPVHMCTGRFLWQC